MTTTQRMTHLTVTLAVALYAAAACVQADDGRTGQQDLAQAYRATGPAVDLGQVRLTLRNHRDLLGPAAALPPGIQKNLARGKPLPPGIARNLDNRLLGQLPYYEGYEWKQLGRDVILVGIATGIVHEILENVLD